MPQRDIRNADPERLARLLDFAIEEEGESGTDQKSLDDSLGEREREGEAGSAADPTSDDEGPA